MDHTSTGLAGEFYVLAQLAHRDIVASLTFANTKGVDILVSNAKLNQLFKIEVKTTKKKPSREALFGDGLFYHWPMSAKHEALVESKYSEKMVFCFVALGAENEMPRFFIVPGRYVGKYVREQHRFYLKTRRHRVADTSMRTFRIGGEDPLGFENNWEILAGAKPKPKHLYVNEAWYREKRGA